MGDVMMFNARLVLDDMLHDMIYANDPQPNHIKALQLVLKALDDSGIQLPEFPNQNLPKG